MQLRATLRAHSENTLRTLRAHSVTLREHTEYTETENVCSCNCLFACLSVCLCLYQLMMVVKANMGVMQTEKARLLAQSLLFVCLSACASVCKANDGGGGKG